MGNYKKCNSSPKKLTINHKIKDLRKVNFLKRSNIDLGGFMWYWDSRTHQFIMQQALKKCNPRFVHLLEIEQQMLLLGIEAPDKILMDFTNHYYNCTPNSYGYHYGSVIKKICSKLELLEQILRNPNKIIIDQSYPSFLHLFLDSPLKVFCFELGTLSHYVADLHQPFHTDGKERFDDEEIIHKVLEADVRKHLDELKINLHRRSRIKNPEEYFMNKVCEINRFYDILVENYYLSKGKVKPERWIHSKQIIEYCIQESAQTIANIILDFEDSAKIFDKAKKFSIIQDKIKKEMDFNNSYKIKIYKSGTISIRIKK